MAFSVHGKTAIITGAGSGINLAFANLLLSKGCNVLIADLALRPEAQRTLERYSTSASTQSKSKASASADADDEADVVNDGEARAAFLKTDVVRWQDLGAMFVAAEREFGNGGADIVVPGAGVYEPQWSNFWQPPGTSASKDAIDGDRYALLDINLTHPIRTTQLAIAHFLEKKKKGSILHISSIAGQLANPIAPMYVATKFGISGFVRSLARLEAELGIRVTAVAPGVIRTPLWTEAPEHLSQVTALDEWATPEEVAEAMLDLIEKDECSAGKLEGGTILEVGKDQRRIVGMLNDPGPSGPGHTVKGNAIRAGEMYAEIRRDGFGRAEGI